MIGVRVLLSWYLKIVCLISKANQECNIIMSIVY